MNPFSYARATDADAASRMGATLGAKFLGGGTNLVDLMKYGAERPRQLVDLSGLDGLRGVGATENGGVRIGALVTNADAAAHPMVQQRLPLLASAILHGATPQFRNMATMGGNLLQRTRCTCFYDRQTPCNKRAPGTGCPAREGVNKTLAILGHSEHCIATHPGAMAVACAALGCVVHLRGPRGEGRRLAARRLPPPASRRAGARHESGAGRGDPRARVSVPARSLRAPPHLPEDPRASLYAFALVSVAAALDVEGGAIRAARLALGGVAHKPWRREEAERAVAGLPPGDAAASCAADILLEGAQGFCENAFKIPLARIAIRRARSVRERHPAAPRPEGVRLMFNGTHVGQPRPRVDGALKVTGRAKYAADFSTNGLLHCAAVGSPVANGRVARIDTSRAEAFPGVVKVFTQENRPRTAWFDRSWKDQIGPPGLPFRPLYDAAILFAMQLVALVVAEEWGIARHAASLIEVECEAETPETDLKRAQAKSYELPKQRSGIAPPPKPRGDVVHGVASAAACVRETYEIKTEHHAAMEPHATTVIVKEGGKLLVHDKTQGVQNIQTTICSVFGLSKSDVHVVTPFLGGGFGSGLRPTTNMFLAVMAALDLRRSVRLALHRDQVFAMTHHRPETFVTAGVAATPEGKLTVLEMDAIAATSSYEDQQEVVVKWPGHLYDVSNASFGYRLAKLDTHSPGDQRAPRAPLGVFAAESAMDELAHKLGMDPLVLRLNNIAEEKDLNDGKPFTLKELRAARQIGSERFGWGHRNLEPRSSRAGRELVGLGMACGVWEAQTQKHAAAVTLHRDGRAEVRCATSDLGTGTYTILAQIAADSLGLPMEAVSVRLGDSDLPPTPVSGGCWTAASAGTAVQLACAKVAEQLFRGAQRIQGSPVYGATVEEVRFREGPIVLVRDPSQGVGVLDALAATGEEKLEAEEAASPNPITQLRYSSSAHSAVFAEVRLDEELLVPRVTRVTCAVAAGRVLNPRTARSQSIGGVVWGLSQTLHGEGLWDHTLGRQMNHNLAEYHLPVNADVPPIEVVFVDERDDKTSPIGVKGLGEIGIVGTATAVANAIFHATGKRLRGLPMTPDRVLFG